MKILCVYMSNAHTFAYTPSAYLCKHISVCPNLSLPIEVIYLSSIMHTHTFTDSFHFILVILCLKAYQNTYWLLSPSFIFVFYTSMKAYKFATPSHPLSHLLFWKLKSVRLCLLLCSTNHRLPLILSLLPPLHPSTHHVTRTHQCYTATVPHPTPHN